VSTVALIATMFAIFASAHAVTMRSSRNATAEVDIAALKQQVLESDVVHAKISQVCQNKGSECESAASEAIFCQLLERSRKSLLSSACPTPQAFVQTAPAAKASTGSLASLRAKVFASANFQHDAQAMSVSLGCNGVKKADTCSSYVQEAAFCLAFAEKYDTLKAFQGSADEVKYCQNIDKQLPELAMLLQEKTGAVLLQLSSLASAPEDDLAKEMTHDLEMNFNKIAPFGKEDTAKELQDHAAKTQDTLVDAVENAEVAEIKRAVFRALTRLRAATIKEFDTIARLETQAIDAYNDAHHYRAENPLAHLHEDEAPVETDKLKSFH